jgi:hypothetical protein
LKPEPQGRLRIISIRGKQFSFCGQSLAKHPESDSESAVSESLEGHSFAIKEDV